MEGGATTAHVEYKEHFFLGFFFEGGGGGSDLSR